VQPHTKTPAKYYWYGADNYTSGDGPPAKTHCRRSHGTLAPNQPPAASQGQTCGSTRTRPPTSSTGRTKATPTRTLGLSPAPALRPPPAAARLAIGHRVI
jgi:hypothetical protein